MRLAKDTRRFPTTIFPASGITIYFVVRAVVCAPGITASTTDSRHFSFMCALRGTTFLYYIQAAGAREKNDIKVIINFKDTQMIKITRNAQHMLTIVYKLMTFILSLFNKMWIIQ